MSDLILRILEKIIGGPTAVFATLVFAYALYRMTRHQLLLFGYVLDTRKSRNGGPPEGLEGGGHDAGREYEYTFYIQNVEEFSFSSPFQVRIINPHAAGDEMAAPDVKVFAGPRHVERVEPKEIRDRQPGISDFRFEKLSPFDTWKFVCKARSQRLRLEIVTNGGRTRFASWLATDVWPKSLGLDATHGLRKRFKGLTLAPGLAVLVAMMIVVTLLYVTGIAFIHRHPTDFGVSTFPYDWYDLIVILILQWMLWWGYRRIQRPVYPIIQGYSFETLALPADTTQLRRRRTERASFESRS